MIGIVFALSSCQNELNEIPNPPVTDSISVVQTPDVVAYSGDNLWGSTFIQTRSAQPNSNQWGTDDNNGIYKDFPRPDDITDAERQKVVEVFSQKGETKYEPLVNWSNFFVQQVYCGPEGEKMTELACWDPVGHEFTTYPEWNGWQAWTEIVNDDIVNNFNNGAYSGDKTQGCMLMFDSSTSNWSFKSTQGGGERFYNWRMEYIDGAYYVGFDFQSNKQGSEANDNELFERDYIYNDWIIKIVPGKSVTVTPPSEDGPDTPVVTPSVFDAVEINLSANDSVTSHLSIHVRAVTNVEVFIPIPAKYYCDVDDMAIVQKHLDDLMVHGGPKTTVYNVGGVDVSLNIEFKPEGIRIWTEGINEEVISYCKENFKDGITFEVWNYFNGELDREGLLELLNEATVTFTDKIPGYYINAFNKTDTNGKFQWDATVTPTQEESFDSPDTGWYYNGSPYNEIYTKH